MMAPQTVQQLLHVFRNFQENHASGIPLHRSYQKAVRTVADAYSITYQTVGDGCRRRLGLNAISELYELLAAWVKGEPYGLVCQLKASSEPSSHTEIDQFFSGGDVTPTEIGKALPKSLPYNKTETFSFRLPEHDARMLRALAELEGVSVAELTVRTVSAAIRDQMAVVARGIIKSAGAN